MTRLLATTASALALSLGGAAFAQDYGYEQPTEDGAVAEEGVLPTTDDEMLTEDGYAEPQYAEPQYAEPQGDANDDDGELIDAEDEDGDEDLYEADTAEDEVMEQPEL